MKITGMNIRRMIHGWVVLVYNCDFNCNTRARWIRALSPHRGGVGGADRGAETSENRRDQNKVQDRTADSEGRSSVPHRRGQVTIK